MPAGASKLGNAQELSARDTRSLMDVAADQAPVAGFRAGADDAELLCVGVGTQRNKGSSRDKAPESR